MNNNRFNYSKVRSIEEIFGGDMFETVDEDDEINEDINNEDIDLDNIELSPKFLDSNGKEIRFDDVIGYQSIKDKLKQILSYIKDVDKYKSHGVDTPKGIFILGQPGIGKTMLSEAFVNESNLKCYFVTKKGNSSTFPIYLEKVFNEADKNAPCIILLDDIDKFSGKEKDTEIFNTLQGLIDRVRNKDVYIIATANSDKHLPKSLIRDGRFDTKITINEISKEDKVDLLKHFLSTKNISDNLNFNDATSIIVSSTPVSIKKTVNTAMLIAINKNKNEPDIEDFIEAFLDINLLLDKYKKEENYLEVCYHEAGHALISEAVKSKSVGFISAIRTGFSGGSTILQDGIKHRIPYVMTCLAGKVSVELNLAKNASGCTLDIVNAKDSMFDGIRNNSIDGFIHTDAVDSDITDAIVNTMIGLRLNSIEKMVKSILITNRDLLKSIVDTLFEKGYVLRSELDKLLEQNPIKIDEMTYFR